MVSIPARRRAADAPADDRPRNRQVTRGRLAVHAHFYQPSRSDPFTGRIPPEPTAAPFHDYNEKILAECYRPNAERGNLERVSFDVGPTLASWLAQADPGTYERFLRADRALATIEHGQAMAQAYHHTILPLASLADRRTEIRWGLRDFELRFGRPAVGFWLPETAVDLPTLRLLAEEGVQYTILAPWQSAEPHLETRRPYRVALGGGLGIIAVFYDGPISAAVSFDASATSDAHQFVRRWIEPRLAEPLNGPGPDDRTRAAPGRARAAAPARPVDAPGDGDGPREVPMVVIATDGEFYGHHQKFRDLFLQRLIGADGRPVPGDFELVALADAVLDPTAGALRTTRIQERTSWSCLHGVARWSAECPDVPDGRWKGPLRAALERLAAGIDVATERLLVDVVDRAGFEAARDAYVDVVFGADGADAFAARHLPDGSDLDRERFLHLLDAQRWRLAMFASDGWFWEDPARIETGQVLRAAAKASRMVDDAAGTDLERRLLEDLSLLTSPSRHVDGVALYREALAGVGQPVS